MEIDVITEREEELKAKRARVAESLDAIDKELEELAVAKNVMQRLSGKKAAPSSPPKARRKRVKTETQKKPEGLPTIRELVLEALMDARQRGLPGLAPKGIREYVAKAHQYEMGSTANTVPSRMWRDEKSILKDTETGLFSLPLKDEAGDDLLGRTTSPASDHQPGAQGREAGPGGGTWR